MVLDGGHDAGVGAGPADPALLQLLDQRGLGVAGRRLREVLLRQQLVEAQCLALPQFRQAAVLVFVLSSFPNLVEAVEGEHRAAGAERVLATLNLGHGVGVLGGSHAAGDEAPPDHLVQAELLIAQEAADVLRAPARIGGPDRLVGLLGADPRLVAAPAAQVAVAELALDPAADLALGLGADAGGVGAHVGDEAGAALGA